MLYAFFFFRIDFHTGRNAFLGFDILDFSKSMFCTPLVLFKNAKILSFIFISFSIQYSISLINEDQYLSTLIPQQQQENANHDFVAKAREFQGRYTSCFFCFFSFFYYFFRIFKKSYENFLLQMLKKYNSNYFFRF